MQQIWGVASTNCEAQAQILDMLQTWGKESDSDSGKDSNPRPGKCPAML